MKDLKNLEMKIIDLSDDLYSTSPEYISGYVQCQMDVVNLLRKENEYGESRSADTKKGVPCK